MARVAGKVGSAVTTTKSDSPGHGYTARMYYGFGGLVLLIVIILVVLLLLGRI
jgi:hypothetical protein